MKAIIRTLHFLIGFSAVLALTNCAAATNDGGAKQRGKPVQTPSSDHAIAAQRAARTGEARRTEGPARQGARPNFAPNPSETKAASPQPSAKKIAIPADHALVTGRVVDAKTQRPVAGAVVLYGACGTRRAVADSSGRYELTVPWGSVYLHVAHRAYQGTEARFQAAKGSVVTRDFSLAKKPGPEPKQVKLEGKIQEKVYAKGTRSEYREILLRPSAPSSRPVVVFDASGCTAPMAKWAGRTVQVMGYYGTGSVGWMHRPARGLIVESIVPIPKTR